MKNNPFKYFVFLMLSLLMVATTGCTEDDISMPAGQLPDETPMNSVGGQLCSGKTFSNKITVSMYEGDGAVTEEICYPKYKEEMNRAVQYVVYRFNDKEKVNIDDPSHIVAIMRDNFYKLPYEDGKTKYRYVVTALDRLHNESKSVGKKIKL